MGDSDEAKVHVGNLPYDVTEDQLRDAFETHAAIVHVNIIKDQETGRSKGFGFVTFEDSKSAQDAIDNLQLDLGGRTITVNKPNPRGGGRGSRY